ncbi:hypothetical protein WSM22_41860 [Cytophagales bacterium WSM2-2]|nr:hypothetical protein WSM22_41860 [Cytophagales bacterium WSM2-2]
MKNKLIVLSIAFAAWTALVILLSQYQLNYSIAVTVAGTLAFLAMVRKLIADFGSEVHTRLYRDKVNPGHNLSTTISEIYQGLDDQNRKMQLSISSIIKLGQHEEVGALDPLLQNDAVGHALAEASKMITRIKTEESQRHWASEGLAMFSKLLANKTDLKEFGNSIISTLVKYMGLNQGGLFLESLDDDRNRYLELIACYAYERRKYLEGRIEVGQGLLGQCMLEKDFIFITDVPKEYVRITSGLGYATPRNIVVAPLMIRDVFYGAIELGSFKILEPYQTDFLKKVCEIIASEIESIKNFEKTKLLLSESKTLTTELQSREEEMKQNLEELAITQEQTKRKQVEIDNYLAAINITIASAEFTIDGNFTTANDIFLKLLGYTNEELAGCGYLQLMPEESSARMMWESLKLGKFFSGEFRLRDKQGQESWLTGTFNPIIGLEGNIERIMMLAQFTTQEKERANDLTEMVNALKATVSVAEFNEQFVCKTANDRFMKLFGINRLQLRGRSMYDFIHEGDIKGPAIQDILSRGNLSTVLPVKINNQVVAYEASISKSRGLDGQISKYILVLAREADQSKIPMMAAV